MESQNKADQVDVRTAQLPAQEKITFDMQQQPPLLSAEQVYAQRQYESIPDGSICAPTYIP
jgi:hypothetical protein